MTDHQIDEEMILRDEVSDEAVEAAAFVALGGAPLIAIGGIDPLQGTNSENQFDKQVPIAPDPCSDNSSQVT